MYSVLFIGILTLLFTYGLTAKYRLEIADLKTDMLTKEKIFNVELGKQREDYENEIRKLLADLVEKEQLLNLRG